MSTERLLNRFIKYVKVHSASKENVEDHFPSTGEQIQMAQLLAEDLRQMGLSDVTVDQHGYVFATLPGNLPPGKKAPVVGLLAHMDTYPGVSGRDVKPILHAHYDGKDIVLPGDPDQVIRATENPDLAACLGQTIVTSDGTTLLGADDKAGIAEILEAVERMKADTRRPRSAVRIGFTPDEEVGNGTAHFDLKTFGADIAYTADGSAPHEVENETFSADSALVTIQGRDVHPGYAKGKMINAVRIAARFIDLIPAGLCCEHNSERQGFLHPTDVAGDVSQAKVSLLVRDFSVEGLQEKEKLLQQIADSLMREYPQSRIDIQIKESYRNMRYFLDKNPRVVELALKAVEKAGLKPHLTSIRGGTDGSRLSAMGLLTPNLAGGGRNFHSKQEWISVTALEQSTRILMELVYLWAEESH